MPEEVSLESIVAISDDAVSRDFKGQVVILNLESGTYFGLEELGTRIWALFQEGGSLRRVFEAIHQEYDVSPDILERDLLRLVEELRTKGLVIISPSQENQDIRA
jgi:coenzyme PQQ synthesis protein D (PqqD)